VTSGEYIRKNRLKIKGRKERRNTARRITIKRKRRKSNRKKNRVREKVY
jgi:hypothetical protein